MRSALLALLVALVLGCAHAPPQPSTAAQRTPTPGTVTRDNPAGDAEAPVDAALTRLLEQPLGTKMDRFRTLKARFPDHGNWKRVRFFGHPTRAGFRYGKEGYAIAVLSYSEADGDDSPRACLERFVKNAARKADAFEVELGPMTREMHKHYRGPESVDWAEHDRRQQEKRAERQQRRLEFRRRAAAHLLELKFWRAKRRAEAAKRRAEAAKRTPQPDSGEAVAEQPQPSGERPDAQPPQPAASNERPAAAPPQPDVDSAGAAEGAGQPDAGAKPPKTSNKQPTAGKMRLRLIAPHKLRALSKRLRAERAKRKRARQPISRAEVWRRHKQRFGETDMPVIRTSGQFKTLLVRDRYLAAVAAYRSWPDTCLVQGFVVRVGSDEGLARRVIDRWIEEIAPKLLWVSRTRSAPPFKNR